MKLRAIIVAVLSVPCSTPQVAPKHAAPPEVDQRFASLSHQGMLEIAALPNGHPEILRPVFRIHMVDPGWAEVESGRRPKTERDKTTLFSAHKENGHWVLVKGSVRESGIVTVIGRTKPMKPIP